MCLTTIPKRQPGAHSSYLWCLRKGMITLGLMCWVSTAVRLSSTNEGGTEMTSTTHVVSGEISINQ
jgi:hypothetical protein